jgi:hypothetical protein
MPVLMPQESKGCTTGKEQDAHRDCPGIKQFRNDSKLKQSGIPLLSDGKGHHFMPSCLRIQAMRKV